MKVPIADSTLFLQGPTMQTRTVERRETRKLNTQSLDPRTAPVFFRLPPAAVPPLPPHTACRHLDHRSRSEKPTTWRTHQRMRSSNQQIGHYLRMRWILSLMIRKRSRRNKLGNESRESQLLKRSRIYTRADISRLVVKRRNGMLARGRMNLIKSSTSRRNGRLCVRNTLTFQKQVPLQVILAGTHGREINHLSGS